MTEHTRLHPKDAERLWELLRPTLAAALEADRQRSNALAIVLMTPTREADAAFARRVAKEREILARMEDLHTEKQRIVDAFVPAYPRVALTDNLTA